MRRWFAFRCAGTNKKVSHTMRFGNIAKKAKDYLGNKDNHGKINETIDKAQKQHGSKLDKHGDKVNKFVDGQQEKRFGSGERDENRDPDRGESRNQGQ